MYYGNKTISFCGCEIIATFNAIYDIKGYHYISFPEMINDFEYDQENDTIKLYNRV